MTIIIKALTAVFAPKTSCFAWIWNAASLSYGMLARNDTQPSNAYYCALVVMLLGGVIVVFGAELATLANTAGYALVPMQSLNAWTLLNADSIADKVLFAAITVATAYLIYYLTYKLPNIRRIIKAIT